MTLLQEAYTLVQGQPEKNLQLIVELLQIMSSKEDAAARMPSKDFKWIGLAKKAVSLPCDFDETFDALDREIEELFYGETL